MASRGKARTQAELAKALGVSRQRIGQMIREGKIPPKPQWGWDVDDVKRGQAAGAKKLTVLGERSPSAGSGSIYSTLSSADNALEVARAAMQLASRSVAEASMSGGVDSKDLDALKKTLEELRRHEASAISLARERGELILRSVAAAVSGELAARGVRVLDAVGTEIAQQVQIWWGDDEFSMLDTSQQEAVVRAWYRDMSRSARQVEADEVQALIDLEREAFAVPGGAS